MRVERIVMVTIVCLGLVVAPGTVLVFAHGDEHTISHGQPHSLGPAPPNKRYDTPTAPPRITRKQAIMDARTSIVGGQVERAKRIDANYVLFSDDAYHIADSAGHPHLAFQRTPAWIIVLSGVNFSTRGGSRPHPGQPAKTIQYAHEFNIVINAETGDYMEAFSSR